MELGCASGVASSLEEQPVQRVLETRKPNISLERSVRISTAADCERGGLLPKCEDIHFPTSAWIAIYFVSTFALLCMNWIAVDVNLKISSSIVFWAVVLGLTCSALIFELRELERHSKSGSCINTPKEDTHAA